MSQVQVSFFTPIVYGDEAPSEWKAIERIDNYFHFCGRKARVVSSQIGSEIILEKVQLEETKFSAATLLKIVGVVLSFFTVTIPLVMLISKAALRSSHKYEVIDEENTPDTEELDRILSNYGEKAPKIKEQALGLMDAINKKIETSETMPEFVFINTHENPFVIGIKCIDNSIDLDSFSTDLEYYRTTYLGHAVTKLEELGHIELTKWDAYGLTIKPIYRGDVEE